MSRTILLYFKQIQHRTDSSVDEEKRRLFSEGDAELTSDEVESQTESDNQLDDEPNENIQLKPQAVLVSASVVLILVLFIILWN